MTGNRKKNNVISFQPKAMAVSPKPDEELHALSLAWEELGYSKFSTLKDQMEWSVMEVLLLEACEFRFIGSSYVDYPAFPSGILEEARKILAAAQRARSLLVDFALPPRKQGQSLRRYQAGVADSLERHLSAALSPDDASMAGDYYLTRCISDPPLGWEE